VSLFGGVSRGVGLGTGLRLAAGLGVSVGATIEGGTTDWLATGACIGTAVCAQAMTDSPMTRAANADARARVIRARGRKADLSMNGQISEITYLSNGLGG
jgi:hypothetical protein